MNADQRPWMLAVTLSFIASALVCVAGAAEPAYELTNAINQLTSKEIPAILLASDASLRLTLPEFLPPPPRRDVRCGDFTLIPQDCVEYWLKKFEQEQILLPIERYVEHFGMPIAPGSYGCCQSPPLNPEVFYAALRYRKRRELEVRTTFYTLFPSLPQLTESIDAPLLGPSEESVGPYESLQLAGIGDCMLEPKERPAVTPIEWRLAQGMPMASPPATDGIRSPQLDSSPQSAPVVVSLNWVIASVGRWR
jgi:hypothetical protein